MRRSLFDPTSRSLADFRKLQHIHESRSGELAESLDCISRTPRAIPWSADSQRQPHSSSAFRMPVPDARLLRSQILNLVDSSGVQDSNRSNLVCALVGGSISPVEEAAS